MNRWVESSSSGISYTTGSLVGKPPVLHIFRVSCSITLTLIQEWVLIIGSVKLGVLGAGKRLKWSMVIVVSLKLFENVKKNPALVKFRKQSKECLASAITCYRSQMLPSEYGKLLTTWGRGNETLHKDILILWWQKHLQKIIDLVILCVCDYFVINVRKWCSIFFFFF